MLNSVQSALVNPLEPSSWAAACRAERLDAGGREIVDDPGDERRLRADHDKIHLVALQKPITAAMVGDIERDAFGLAGDAGIARRAP